MKLFDSDNRRYLYALLGLGIIGAVQAGLVVNKVDGWPLSRYPMFSEPKVDGDVVNYQIHFEQNDGTTKILRWGGSRVETLLMQNFVVNEQSAQSVVRRRIKEFALQNSIPVAELKVIKLVQVQAHVAPAGHEIIEDLKTLREIQL